MHPLQSRFGLGGIGRQNQARAWCAGARNGRAPRGRSGIVSSTSVSAWASRSMSHLGERFFLMSWLFVNVALIADGGHKQVV